MLHFVPAMRSASIAVLLSVALGGVLGCTASHQTTPTAPSDSTSGTPPGEPCTFSIVETLAPFNASGGNGTTTVSTQPNCRWGVSAASPWISIDAARTFAGPATFPLVVDANRSFTGRSGTVEIRAVAGSARATQAVTQRGAGCLYSIDPPTLTRPWLGTSDGSDVGGFEAHVHAEPAGCRWTVTSTVPWMYPTFGSRPEGTGDATIYVAMLWNSAPSTRVGELVVAGLSGVNPDAHLVATQTGR